MDYPEDITPREETPGATSRLFSFYRLRANASLRFYPNAGARLKIINRAADTLILPNMPSGFLAAGDKVSVKYKGATVFVGEVDEITERKSRGLSASQTVKVVGPWSKMSRLVYRQQWFTGEDLERSSRLILNQTQAGQPQTLNAALTEIAAHAANVCGYTAATVNVSSQVLPSDECRDITIADAIRRELRFFPKAICRFDYSTATPTLYIQKRDVSASYVANIPKTEREYVYNAHPITGVDLEIETTGEIEGVTYHQITHQTAGDTTAGNPDCLYATLQIKGASANATRQSFVSVTETIPTNLNNVDWWKARHPRLANVASSAITITDAARTPDNLPRISASTAGEIEAAGLECEVSKFTCKAKIQTDDDTEEDILLTLHYLTTNATGTAENPRTYTWITDSSSESGETVPEGLAQAILNERSGSLVSERLTIRLGANFPVLGDKIVETSGSVYLQSFEVDCDNLTADLEFGVPDYLTPEDMASLLTGFRNKCTTRSTLTRKTGAPSATSEVEMGAIPPLLSSEFAPGNKMKTTIGGGTRNNKIVLDPNVIGSSNKTLGVKIITNGSETIHTIADKDFTVSGGAKMLGNNDDMQSYKGPFNQIRFWTNNDSNIKIKVEEDGDIRIGAYYV